MKRRIRPGILVVAIIAMLQSTAVGAASEGTAAAGAVRIGGSPHQTPKRSGLAPQDTASSGRSSSMILPILYYTPETRLAVGVAAQRLFRPGGGGEGRPSTLIPMVIVTQNRQIILQFNSSFYLDRDRWYIMGNIHYVKFPSTFWGVGRDTPDDAEEDFTRRYVQIQAEVLRRVGSALQVGARVEYQPSRITGSDAGGLLDQGSVVGSEKGTLSGLGAVVQWDTRDNIFAPWTGGYYRLLAMGFGSGLGSTWSFSEVSLDLRRFLNTGGGRVLATQIALWDAAGSVPFFRLAMLGGPLLLRGYFEGRYRNRAGAVVQAEYRVPVSRIIGLAGFGGVGDVADKRAWRGEWACAGR